MPSGVAFAHAGLIHAYRSVRQKIMHFKILGNYPRSASGASPFPRFEWVPKDYARIDLNFENFELMG